MRTITIAVRGVHDRLLRMSIGETKALGSLAHPVLT